MDIVISVTDGDRRFGVDMKDRDPARVAEDLAVAAHVLKQQLCPLDTAALIAKVKELSLA